MSPRRPWSEDDRWFKVWFAFATLVGLIVTGVVIWAVIVPVEHFTR